MADNDKILTRIRGLLAKAEGTDNEHERKTFMAAAESQMAKYGIDRARLAYLRPGREKPELRSVEVADPWMREQATLVHGVAEALRCRAVWMRAPRAKKSTMDLLGFAPDLERAELLYTSLMLQMFRALNRQGVPFGHTSTKAKRDAYSRSFLHGFISEALNRIRAAEQRAADEAQDAPGEVSTEIVLIERDQVVHAMFAKMYPKLSKGRKVTVDADAYNRGAEAGRRADVGGTRLDGAPQAALR
ncbi:DUF2786 domain-containing protein [Nonomuraea maritima]|uniref:DUF2786 domain-containing protein n=1 Tax=Nonomuraea maritima TaxID=683260 RepID=UPI003710ABBD